MYQIGRINENSDLQEKNENQEDEREKDERRAIDSNIQHTNIGNNGDLPESNIIEHSKIESTSLGSKDLLKNYETTSRKSIFPPASSDDDMDVSDENDASEDEESIINPVQKVRSPTLEDLIDEEFL